MPVATRRTTPMIGDSFFPGAEVLSGDDIAGSGGIDRRRGPGNLALRKFWCTIVSESDTESSTLIPEGTGIFFFFSSVVLSYFGHGVRCIGRDLVKNGVRVQERSVSGT